MKCSFKIPVPFVITFDSKHLFELRNGGWLVCLRKCSKLGLLGRRKGGYFFASLFGTSHSREDKQDPFSPKAFLL